MATSTDKSIIAGSARPLLQQSRAVGPVQPDQSIEVTVTLKPAAPLPVLAPAAVTPGEMPVLPQVLSHAEFARQHGASASAIATVKDFAHQHGLVVVSSNAARRCVVLSGTAQQYCAAFDAQLEEHEYPDGSYRALIGPIKAPPEVAAVIEGVFGLDDRPQATPKYQVRQTSETISLTAAAVATTNGAIIAEEGAAVIAAAGAYTPVQVARFYDFPTGLDGSGQCIGIIELGGGSRPADIQAYFSALGLPTPNVKSISVDHAKNHPTNANSADVEVMLDIEVAAAIAPKATIAVYYAPNTDRGFLDAITTAVHDTVNKPSVISISWGAAEVHWSAQALTAYEQAFADAAALGVTICCASGDAGSSDGESDGQPHVDFPASAPHALGCGGTKLTVANGGISESVWNEGPNSATGGGYSAYFARPDYQGAMGSAISGRGVPDIAGDADPASGYIVRVDGKQLVVGGTSAVAPLWAGLIALLNQKLGRPVGFIHPLLYGGLAGEGATHDITVGNNGAQQAKPGWDACTGWGTPDGAALVRAIAC